VTDYSAIAKLTRRKRRLRIVTSAAIILGASAVVLQTATQAPVAGQARIDNRVLYFESARAFERGDAPVKIEYLATVVFATSGTSFSVPPDWSATNNVVCIGPGSRGVAPVAGTNGGHGGGGGAYALTNNIAGLTPGGTCPMVIGAANSGTNTSFNTSSVIAQAATANSRTAGTAASSTGSSKNNGGTGGDGGAGSAIPTNGGGGGGGAGGSAGAGANGGTDNNQGGAGGASGGTAGGGGGASPGTGSPGNNGSAGTQYTQTVPSITAGPGGGGSGSGSANGASNGGDAGNYGAGAGGGCSEGANGNAAAGLIVATYTPANNSTWFGGEQHGNEFLHRKTRMIGY
jgi:hypothetical protein